MIRQKAGAGLSSSSTAYVWLAVALLLGALCRFWNLSRGSLFIDEGVTFHIAGLPPKALLSAVAYGDYHPPLFYLVTHYLMQWLHWPLSQYRYLTALAGVTTIAASWAIARARFGNTAAALTALTVAIAPALVQSDRLYRMYAPLAALGSLSWWLLIRIEDTPVERRRLLWVAYGLCAVTLPYLHYLGALIVFSQVLYACTRLPRLWPALAMTCVAGFAFIPWLWAFRVQYQGGGLVADLHSAAFSWDIIVRAVVGYGLSANIIAQPHFDTLFAAATLAVCAGGLYLGRHSLLPYWCLPIAIQLILSLAAGKNLMVARYLYAYLPVLCMSASVLAAQLSRTRYRIAGVLVCAGWLAVGVIGVPNLLFDPYYQWPDWNGVNALLSRNERQGDVIVMVQGAEYWIVRDLSAFRDHDLQAAMGPPDVAPSLLWLQRQADRRVWYIENQADSVDRERRIQRALDQTRHRVAGWRQRRLYREDIVHIALYDARSTRR